MEQRGSVSLNHTCFTVTDIGKTIQFFEECLGYQVEVRQQVPGVIGRLIGVPDATAEQAFLKGNGSRIELLCYQSPSNRTVISSSPVDTGSVHIGVYVDDAKAAVAKAAGHGFALLGDFIDVDSDQYSSPVKAVAWVRNSDGITVEFLEMK